MVTLPHSPHERTRQVAALWGAARIALGATAIVAPRAGTRVWVGRVVPEAGPTVLGRALGGRDIALGAGTLGSALAGRDLTTWAVACGAADAVDGIATLVSRRSLPRGRRELVVVASLGSALLAAAIAARGAGAAIAARGAG